LEKIFHIDHVAAIQAITYAEPVAYIQGVAQSNLSQIITPLAVVSPLRQTLALVVAGIVGAKAGDVAGQQPAGEPVASASKFFEVG
jgi:hypothetical protein